MASDPQPPVDVRLQGEPLLDIGFREGAVILAQAFDNAAPFRVKIMSTDEFGRGASATVCKGEAEFPDGRNSLVALKVLSFRIDQLEHKFFEKELSAARRLERAGKRHPHVLPFMGAAVLGFQTVIISPFMEKGNLLKYLREFPHGNRQEKALQIAEGLRYLHEDVGIVHGDLKCENVLIAADGAAVLADFGLSALIEKAETCTTTTAGVRQWCTVRFAAPELLLDNAWATSGPTTETRRRSKTTASDVYAFAMLMIQLFSGKPPWSEYADIIVAMKILAPGGPMHPRPPNTANLGLTDAWWSVCIRCLAVDPEKRPAIRMVADELKDTVSSDYARRIKLIISTQNLDCDWEETPCSSAKGVSPAVKPTTPQNRDKGKGRPLPTPPNSPCGLPEFNSGGGSENIRQALAEKEPDWTSRMANEKEPDWTSQMANPDFNSGGGPLQLAPAISASTTNSTSGRRDEQLVARVMAMVLERINHRLIPNEPLPLYSPEETPGEYRDRDRSFSPNLPLRIPYNADDVPQAASPTWERASPRDRNVHTDLDYWASLGLHNRPESAVSQQMESVKAPRESVMHYPPDVPTTARSRDGEQIRDMRFQPVFERPLFRGSRSEPGWATESHDARFDSQAALGRSAQRRPLPRGDNSQNEKHPRPVNRTWSEPNLLVGSTDTSQTSNAGGAPSSPCAKCVDREARSLKGQVVRFCKKCPEVFKRRPRAASTVVPFADFTFEDDHSK